MSWTTKNCPGCGGSLKEVAAIGVWQTCCTRIVYGLCVTCAATMQNGATEERATLASAVELSLAVDDGNPQ